jgi:hypothetical protein
VGKFSIKKDYIMHEWKNMIQENHVVTCEGMKEAIPGTPEWNFFMTLIKAYETWYTRSMIDKDDDED